VTSNCILSGYKYFLKCFTPVFCMPTITGHQ
jgi:hypothetical protein